MQKILYLFLLIFFLFNASTFSPLALASTENVTISAIVAGNTVSSETGGSGTGGLSGNLDIPKISVQFSGEAYPNAIVSILKEGAEIMSVLADVSGYFTVTLEEKYDATIIYTLFAKDVLRNKSLLINYPIVIYSGYLTHISGIRFAPTITTDRAEVRAGDYLTVSGYSLPGKNLGIFIEGKEKKIFTLTSKDDGTYKITLPMLGLPKGNYVVYIKYMNDSRISKLIKFIIGDNNVSNTNIVENIPGDCNYDGVINLTDFSVLAFWYGKDNPPPCIDTNRDGKINLVDFSILAFWWTG